LLIFIPTLPETACNEKTPRDVNIACWP